MWVATTIERQGESMGRGGEQKWQEIVREIQVSAVMEQMQEEVVP
jgi:hypothetical protein